MGELIFRPSADAKNEDMQYSSGSSGYLLINEETADEDATYIYGAYTDTTNVKRVYYGTVQPIMLDKRIKVTSVKVYTRCRTTKGKSTDSAQYRVIVILHPNGSSETEYSVFTEDFSVTTSWKTYTNTFAPTDFSLGSNTDDIIFNPGYYTNFGSLGVSLWGKKSANKNDDFQTRVTQLYAVLTYEELPDEITATGIYLKQNGAYTQAQAAYKKVNGVWVQQTDIATLKTEMQSGKYKVST